VNRVRNGLIIAMLLFAAVLFGGRLLPSGPSERIAANSNQLFSDPRSPVVGNPSGDVTVVEFFDYHCPSCKIIAGPLDGVLAEDKGVRLVLKEFPILTEDSVLAARAALAASAQGKYWPFHQALMGHRGTFDIPALKAIAASVGLDAEKLEADMANDKTDPDLQGNKVLARAMGVSGTPTFIVGDQIVEGAPTPEYLKELIARARKG
jgi:protein-disulfide isomerase